MGVISEERDIIDSVVVDAIDHLCRLAPGVSEWWTGLVIPARKLREQYNYGKPFPTGYQSVRPYAYLTFFTPRYLSRLRHALQAADLKLSELLKLTGGSVRILDLGAGTGILTLACLLELERTCQTIEKKHSR